MLHGACISGWGAAVSTDRTGAALTAGVSGTVYGAAAWLLAVLLGASCVQNVSWFRFCSTMWIYVRVQQCVDSKSLS